MYRRVACKALGVLPSSSSQRVLPKTSLIRLRELRCRILLFFRLHPSSAQRRFGFLRRREDSFRDRARRQGNRGVRCRRSTTAYHPGPEGDCPPLSRPLAAHRADPGHRRAGTNFGQSLFYRPRLHRLSRATFPNEARRRLAGLRSAASFPAAVASLTE